MTPIYNIKKGILSSEGLTKIQTLASASSKTSLFDDVYKACMKKWRAERAENFPIFDSL